MKNSNIKPWTDKKGNLLSPEKIKEKSRQWTVSEWEDYLDDTETPQGECLLDVPNFHEETVTNDHEIFSFSINDLREVNQQKKIIAFAMKELTSKQVQVLQLYFWQNKSLREIAEVLDISKAATGRLKDRALQTLGKTIVKSDAFPKHKRIIKL